MTDIKEIEKSLIKKYRKELWSPFIKAVKEFNLIEEGDKVGVAISGGKDSLILAKLIEELHKHSPVNFDVEYLCMNPGYDEENLNLLKENLAYLKIPAKIYDSRVFDISETLADGGNPCYLCARMRRGFLYAKAKDLGCNKLALGHHLNDVIETIMINVLYAGNYKTMKPKLTAQNFDDMLLIRPLYYLREDDIIRWRDFAELKALDCACTVTKSSESHTRKKVKELIADLRKDNPNVEMSILRSSENVNCDMVLAYQIRGEKHSFMEEFK